MNAVEPSYDVPVYKVEVRPGKTRTSYRVRWTVGGHRLNESFVTRKLAESYRAGLLQAASRGEAFDRATGRPQSEKTAARAERRWVQLAREFIDARWEDFSSRHRKCTVEGVVTLTCALTVEGRRPPDAGKLRAALSH